MNGVLQRNGGGGGLPLQPLFWVLLQGSRVISVKHRRLICGARKTKLLLSNWKDHSAGRPLAPNAVGSAEFFQAGEHGGTSCTLTDALSGKDFGMGHDQNNSPHGLG